MKKYHFKLSVLLIENTEINFEDVLEWDDEERYLKLVRENKMLTYISHQQILSYNVKIIEEEAK